MSYFYNRPNNVNISNVFVISIDFFSPCGVLTVSKGKRGYSGLETNVLTVSM